MSRPIFMGCAAMLLATTLVINLIYVVRCGDGLSPFADSYSEACVVRAGERFARDGFTATYGLADPTFGGKFPDQGITGPSGSRLDDPIYQGYPPGPEWLGGLSTRWFGVGRLGMYRILPVTFSLIAATIFIAGLAGAIGRRRALVVYLGCLLTPMFTGMSHGLYYQGYALSLLLIQAALVLRSFAPSGPGRVRPWGLVTLFFLGFLQGWLSFDYCFIATFATVPLALAVIPQDGPVPWKAILIACVISGLGFTAAHGLHFLQSVAYMGGLRPALDEFAFRSKKEYGVKQLLEGRSRFEVLVIGLRQYLVVYLRWNHHFSLAGEVLLGILVGIMAITRFDLVAGPWEFRTIVRRPGNRELIALAASILVALGWFFAKPPHALNHLYFTGRHLFVFYLTGCLVIAQAISIVRGLPTGRESFEATSESAEMLTAQAEGAVR